MSGTGPEFPEILDLISVGSSRHGYRFGVGLIAGRWIGCARIPGDAGGPPRLFIFPQVAEGYTLGLTDRDTAIRLTGAVALDAEAGFGGIDRWHVGPELRGAPADFRCARCGEIHPGDCEPDDLDPETDLP